MLANDLHFHQFNIFVRINFMIKHPNWYYAHFAMRIIRTVSDFVINAHDNYQQQQNPTARINYKWQIMQLFTTTIL